MKAPLLILPMLLASTTGFSQLHTVPHPQPQTQTTTGTVGQHLRRADFIQYATTLLELYNKKDFNAITAMVGRQSQPADGAYRIDADIFCLRILLAIQKGNLAKPSLADRYFFIQLNQYARVMAQVIENSPYILYHSTKGFDGTPYTKRIFSVTSTWARDLLAARQMDSTAAFLCHVFAGDIPRPVDSIRTAKEKYSELDSLISTGIRIHRRGPLGNGAIGFGTWSPQGHLALIGSHPEFHMETGPRIGRNEFDASLSYRWGNSDQPYNLLRRGNIITQDYYDGLYVGMDYTRYLVQTRYFEMGAMAGVGYDSFDFSQQANETSNPLYPTALASLNVNVGMRCKFYFSPRGYFGLTGKYNWMRYNNKGGTPLDGNAVVIELTIGAD